MKLSFASSWLNRYYTLKEHSTEGDSLGTTATSLGAVLLASAVAETRSVQTLTALTGFPAAFVEAVLLVADSVGYFCSCMHAELAIAVHRHPEDLDRIEHVLDKDMGTIWERMDKRWGDALDILRGRYLFGGMRQTWVHDEEEYGPLYFISQGL